MYRINKNGLSYYQSRFLFRLESKILLLLFLMFSFTVLGCGGLKPRIYKTGSEKIPEIICIKTGFTNAFLIPAKKGYLLIDTGYADDYDLFREALSHQKIHIVDISYILLTHHHDDHAGFAAKLAKDSNAVIIAHKDAIPRLSQGKNDSSKKPVNFCVGVFLSIFSIFHNDAYPEVSLKASDIIITSDDNTILNEIGIPGKIIETPGHTKESISVVLDNGHAFIGDAAMDLFSICMCQHRPILVEDEQQVFSSWRKLKEAGAKTVYISHGDPLNIDTLLN